MAHAFELTRNRHAAPDAQPPGAVHRLPHSSVPVEFDSADLLHGQRELHIRHGNEVYRLRHTRNDKLILTK